MFFISISSLNNTSFILGQDSQKFEIEIEKGKRYSWKITEADLDEMQSYFDYAFTPSFRNGKAFIYDILEINESKDYDGDFYWDIYCEFWNYEKEQDDEGIYRHFSIENGSNQFGDELLDILSDNDLAEFDRIDLELFIIPSEDIETYLSEAIIYMINNEGEEISGDFSLDKKELKYSYQKTNITLEYNNDGLLEVLDVLYDGNTLYKLELQEPSNIESYISPMWVFLGIGAIIIIGGIGGVFAIRKLWEYIRIRKQMKEYEIDESYDAEEYSTEDDVDDYERQEPWDLSVENLIKCSNCNNYINQDSTLCPECGTRFIEEGSQDVQIVMEEASDEIERMPSVKNCPKCSSIISSQTTICPFCGAVILKQEKEEKTSPPPPSVLTEIPQPEEQQEMKLNISRQALILLEKIAAKGDQGMTSRQIEQFSELKTNPFIELRNLMGSGLIKRFKKRSGERTYFLTSIGHQALQFFYEQREKE